MLELLRKELKMENNILSADETHDIAKQFLQSYYLDPNEGLYGETGKVLVAIEDWFGFARAIEAKVRGQ